jgi:catechol 2,3-dioxygenase-like lactoylglutathione lyase family enzyme
MTRPKIEQQITFLATSDLQATAAFYEGVLSLPLMLDQGTCRIYGVTHNAYLGFCTHLESPGQTPQVILTLVSQEVDSWYAYLLNKGVVLEAPPALNPRYNIYHFFVRDPDGYLVEIQKFLDSSWPANHSEGEAHKA